MPSYSYDRTAGWDRANVQDLEKAKALLIEAQRLSNKISESPDIKSLTEVARQLLDVGAMFTDKKAAKEAQLKVSEALGVDHEFELRAHIFGQLLNKLG